MQRWPEMARRASFMAILSLALMLFIGLFAASTINQALVVLGLYAFVLAEKRGGEW
jgi:hypothetical protein